MGHRLSKITTKTGDQGKTKLGDGNEVYKNHPRVCALGEIDELNSSIGLLREQLDPSSEHQARLEQIQRDLFDLGGELCIPGSSLIKAEQIERLENESQELNAALAPLKEFILPTGPGGIAYCHMARAICRRAERQIVACLLSEQKSPDGLGLQYLNRLSDWLFILARSLAHQQATTESQWR